MLIPQLVTTLRSYSREQFLADAGAGIVVGIVALPLAIGRTATNIKDDGPTPVAGRGTPLRSWRGCRCRA